MVFNMYLLYLTTYYILIIYLLYTLNVLIAPRLLALVASRLQHELILFFVVVVAEIRFYCIVLYPCCKAK